MSLCRSRKPRKMLKIRRQRSLLLRQVGIASSFCQINYIRTEYWGEFCWSEEDFPSSRNTLVMPKKKFVQLQRSCCGLNVLPTMLQSCQRSFRRQHWNFCLYMAIIIKCARDYERIAWAQYDRNYRKAKGQRKDLCWSHQLNDVHGLLQAGTSGGSWHVLITWQIWCRSYDLCKFSHNFHVLCVAGITQKCPALAQKQERNRGHITGIWRGPTYSKRRLGGL